MITSLGHDMAYVQKNSKLNHIIVPLTIDKGEFDFTCLMMKSSMFILSFYPCYWINKVDSQLTMMIRRSSLLVE
ncbi:protein sprouty 2-like X3 [Biomphalaria pfeifferi]|uniref:Protein sprouty 2-like X3 n=1 Tax=Biomphalaria pfeifferi TaxID=112525 RepID=A0AAD8FI42_BIOPF|nr:protein sprouty 2-like X3 [Biomphalaria pfeifferi]